MLRLLLLISLFCPLCALAQEQLSAEEFDRLTLGKTYSYISDGHPYGAEQYLENRRVRWSFLDGQCMEGRWWAVGRLICFAYEDRPQDHHCWSFRAGPGGLAATFENDPAGRQRYEVRTSDQPLQCLGPKIGV